MTKNILDITPEIKKSDEPMRLAAYCRVSSDSADQLHSFATQIRYYKDYERKHPQYRLVDIYADEGLSGTSMEKRTEMQRLIRDCKKGKIDRIIVKSVSRFARNTHDLLVILRMLKDFNVSVYFEEQDIDTEKLNMELIVTFPGMAAQQESESISGNMRWSIKKRMESGEFNCTCPAYGYKRINGELTVVEEEAVVIRRIFDLYLQGMGKQSIANLLNQENVSRRGRQEKWYADIINYILNNERYMGDTLLQKRYRTESLPFKRAINHGEVPQYYVENSNPSIVSKEIFTAVQKLQKARKCNNEKKDNVYPLSKMMRCPDCGWTFRRQLVAGTAYWICSGKASGATNGCRSIRIQEKEVYETFRCMLSKLIENRKDLLGWLIKQIEEMQGRLSGNREKIREIDKKIADLATQNLIIARLHTNGVLNISEYAIQTSEIGDKIGVLRRERKKILDNEEKDKQLMELKKLNEILAGYAPKNEFDEELFEDIVQSIVVNSNAELTFKLIGEVELTETIREKGRCRTA